MQQTFIENPISGSELSDNIERVNSLYGEAFHNDLVNELGLVRVVFVRPEAPYMPGDVAGIPPEMALKLLAYQVAAPCDENGQAISVKATKRKSEAATASYAVEVPDNWQELHHLQRIRIARELKGSDAKLTAEEADEVIAAEYQRRKETAHG